MINVLLAIPAFNEEATIAQVAERALAYRGTYIRDVLVVDDASTDGTREILPRLPVELLRHARNRGYGRSLIDAFGIAVRDRYDWVITMDGDGQHDAAWIPMFISAANQQDTDVISGSRYLRSHAGDAPPPDRLRINRVLTREINDRFASCLGTTLTDSFCGFKAYRVQALRRLRLSEQGYAFPMQFWVQAAAMGLRVREVPVRRIYTGAVRSFGHGLDEPNHRLTIYREVLYREMRRWAAQLPVASLAADMGAPMDDRESISPKVQENDTIASDQHSAEEKASEDQLPDVRIAKAVGPTVMGPSDASTNMLQ